MAQLPGLPADPGATCRVERLFALAARSAGNQLPAPAGERPSHRDLRSVDPYTNPLGTKEIGEVCVVGAAAAIANAAAYHATGLRIRELPLTQDKFLPREV
jgi:CO/xanthine dehydrogenase Mo-binding subunit